MVNLKNEICEKGEENMRKLLNLFGMALIAMAVLFPISAKAAGKNVCQTLKESKTYQYNLDQKGKKESIRVSVSKKEHKKGYVVTYDVKTIVTINDKKIYSKILKNQNSDNNHVRVMVTDVDRKDKQMELLIIEGDVSDRSSGAAWTSNMEHIYYYQYTDGRAKCRQDIALLFKRDFKNVFFLHGIKDSSFLAINGKNEMYARVCTVVQKNQYDYEDCLHVKVGLMLKKGKFVPLSSKSYEILDIDDKDGIPIRLKKNLTAYTQMGGNKKAFTMKAGEDIPSGSRYCIKNKKAYLRIKNKKGKWGYVELKKGLLYFDGIAHV